MKNNKSKISQKTRIHFAVCVALLAGFLCITIFRLNLNAADSAVNLWIPTIQSTVLTFLAEAIAQVFDTTSLVLISLVISGIFFLKNRKPHGLLLLGAIGGDALIVETIKILDHITRPTNGILIETGFSYPSGHSADVIVFGGVLAYFAWRHWHWQSKRVRTAVGIGLGALVSVVGFDRLYLNVHWLSDVLGGWLFGAFWLSFVVLLFDQLEVRGKFGFERFDFVADLLFVLAVVVSVLVVLSGFIG